MELLKKHYEKILLGVVLLGLVVSAAFLPIMIGSEREALQAMAEAELTRRPKELPPLDLARPEQLLARSRTALSLDFATTHKLFNPVVWKKKAAPDNTPIKAQKGNVGVEAIVVTKTAPLYLTISLDSVTTTDSGARYTIGVEREEGVPSWPREARDDSSIG